MDISVYTLSNSYIGELFFTLSVCVFPCIIDYCLGAYNKIVFTYVGSLSMF